MKLMRFVIYLDNLDSCILLVLGICMGLKCIHNLFCLTNSSLNVDYLMRCICYFLRKSCIELKR